MPSPLQTTSARALCAKPPLALDATSHANNNNSGTGATTLAWSHTVGQGRTSILFVVVAGVIGFPTSVTWGAQALTLIQAVTNPGNVACILYYLLNPQPGTNTITITQAGAVMMAGTARSYLNVDPAAPFGTFYSATGNSTTATVTATESTTADIVFDAVGKRDTTEAITPNASEANTAKDQTTSATASANTEIGSADKVAAAAVMAWTWPTTARQWAMLAIRVRPL